MATEKSTIKVQSGYVQAGDVNMYYEAAGQGRPLLLLHAGFSTIETSFPTARKELGKRWSTIAVEQQAHGHTADIDRTLSYAQMVEDTAALLRKLNIVDADVFGWSDGGIVALGLALRHPDLVRKVAIIGSGFNTDAEKPDFKQLMDKLKPDNEHLAPFRESYEKSAPQPANWPVLIDKVKAMYKSFQGWSRADLRALKAPLMVMLGDDDFLRPEHALELFRLVPNGRLAVLPGSDHSAPLTHTDWVNAMLIDFFDAPMPKVDGAK